MFIFWFSECRNTARRKLWGRLPITVKETFRQMPEVKKQLWGGEFWSDGYYISTVGSSGTEEMLKQYVENQSTTLENIQPPLF